MTVLLPAQPYRIDVLWLAREGIRLLFERWPLAIALGWAPFALTFAAELAAGAFGGHTLVGVLLVGLARSLGLIVFGSIFVVRWHRFVLRDEQVPGALFPHEWRLFVVAGLKLGALVFAALLITMFVAAMLPPVLGAPLALAGGVAVVGAAVRVSLVLPAAAVGNPLTFRASAGLLAGNGLRLFAAAFIAYLPFLILRYLVDRMAMASPSLLWLVLVGASTVITLAGLAVAAAILSIVYRNIAAPAAAWAGSLE